MTKRISTLAMLVLAMLVPVLMVGCQSDPPGAAFTSAAQNDTTADATLPREADGQSAELLSAFLGLDDNPPRGANRAICDEAGGADGMPVIFSNEIDLETMQAGDFQVTTAS